MKVGLQGGRVGVGRAGGERAGGREVQRWDPQGSEVARWEDGRVSGMVGRRRMGVRELPDFASGARVKPQCQGQ